MQKENVLIFLLILPPVKEDIRLKRSSGKGNSQEQKIYSK